MARKRSDQPTDGELEILQFLWDRGPAGLNAVWSGLREHREVANTTVATMLKVMLDKGLVTRRKGPKGWLWTAKKSRNRTAKGMVSKLIDRAFAGSASRLVAHVLDQRKLSFDELDELRQLIEDHATAAKERRKNR